jgi:hypothetical protein
MTGCQMELLPSASAGVLYRSAQESLIPTVDKYRKIIYAVLPSPFVLQCNIVVTMACWIAQLLNFYGKILGNRREWVRGQGAL